MNQYSGSTPRRDPLLQNKLNQIVKKSIYFYQNQKEKSFKQQEDSQAICSSTSLPNNSDLNNININNNDSKINIQISKAEPRQKKESDDVMTFQEANQNIKSSKNSNCHYLSIPQTNESDNRIYIDSKSSQHSQSSLYQPLNIEQFNKMYKKRHHTKSHKSQKSQISVQLTANKKPSKNQIYCVLFISSVFYLIFFISFFNNFIYPIFANCKAVKFFCFGSNIIDKYPDKLCVISIGQVSRGIFSIGQIAIGVVCLGQVGLCVVGIGQGMFGLIYIYGAQVAVALYIKYCQLGVSILTVEKAQVALCPLNSVLFNKNKLYIICCDQPIQRNQKVISVGRQKIIELA